MSEYEKVLKQLGSLGPLKYFGKYQVRVFIIVSMFETPAAWAMLLPILINAKPDWICTDSNTSGSTQNTTSQGCTVDNKACSGIKYTGEFTSIISEVHLT